MIGEEIMENRPMGREKRILSGGTGLKRSGEGLGKEVSERNVKRDGQIDEPKKGGSFEDSKKN